MEQPQYPAARLPGREHIPIYSSGFVGLRIAQLVLAVIILGLSAYGVWGASGLNDFFTGCSLLLAVAVLSMVSSAYLLIAHYGPPVWYNYWAILGLDVFLVIMWLCGFAVQASQIAPWIDAGYGGYVWFATQIAGAGLGAGAFVLFIVSLVLHSIALHRHRAAGLHCMPPSSTSAAPAPAAAAAPPTAAVPVVYPSDKVPDYTPHPQHPQAFPPQAYPPQGAYPPQAYPPQGAYPAQPFPPQQQQQQQGFPPQPFPPQQQQQPPQAYYAAPASPAPTAATVPIVPQPTGGSPAGAAGQPAPPPGAVELPNQVPQSQLPQQLPS